MLGGMKESTLCVSFVFDNKAKMMKKHERIEYENRLSQASGARLTESRQSVLDALRQSAVGDLNFSVHSTDPESVADKPI